MQKLIQVVFISLLLHASSSVAQNEILFSIGDTKVYKSEFEYIYKKNNFTNKADFSRKSLEDYLNLYINFRLKVKEAIAQGLDTGYQFKEELKVYEKQLLESYVEKDVLDKLVKQEFERSKTDINLSHIFFATGNNDDEAFKKVKEAYSKIKSGSPFEEVAKLSEDKATADNGGKVGWLNSYQMSFPEMEEIAYKMKKGEVAEPVKTRLGYHIIKLNETRPARPKLKVAIVKRFLPVTDTSAASKKRVEDTIRLAYAKIKAGEPFEKVVELYSEDEASKLMKGEMEWFGINTYASIFEETAYALKDGEVAAPFKTKTAWYIVKRLQTAKSQSYEESVPVLKAKLANLPVYQYEMDKFVQNLTDKFSIKVYKENIPLFKERIISLSSAVPFTYRDTTSAKTLIQIGNTVYTENDYGKKIQEIYYSVYPKAGSDKNDILIKNTTQTFVLDYYKKYLKENNAEYKALMDEYRNGIMIFSLSENNIWNKAAEDSVGLLSYYNQHKEDFNLKQRATIRKISTSTDLQAKALHKLIKNKPQITDDSLLIEMKKLGLSSTNLNSQIADQTKTKLNITQENLSNPKFTGKNYEFTQIYNLQAAKSRAFEECRGYVVAAYQEYLEKKWLETLRQKFPVEVNKTVFESLIKKQ